MTTAVSLLPDDYLKKEYELRVSYLKDHFTRMWTRFNFFLTINTGLLALAFNISPTALLILAGTFGLAMCVWWNHFAATDNYLVAVYRSQIAHAHYLLIQGTDYSALKAKPLPPVLSVWTYAGDVVETYFDPQDGKVKAIPKNFWQRHSFRISVTELGIVVSALYALAWISLIGVKTLVMQ
jgi:hypothetical protein